MNWREYAFALLGFSAVSHDLHLRASSGCRSAALESAGAGRRGSGSGMEYRGQFYHQHQLAVVHARDDDELSDRDGGAGDAQFLVGGGGHRGGRGADSRHQATASGTIGNFWVDMTRTLLYVLLPASLIYALLLVAQGVPQNLNAYTRRIRWKAGADADHRAGAGGFAGSHQDAGHQRRRLLQRQQRPPVRESDAVVEIICRCCPSSSFPPG